MGGALDTSFRKAMRTLTSAVCVVSTAHAQCRFGMTATAVTALSADPPSLLICVNRAASLHRPLIESRRFCLNVLHAHQTALAESFGGGRAGQDRFQCGLWTENQDGVPCLENAQANVFCDVDAVHPYATHSVVIGRVIAVRVSGTITPLLYQDGRYTVGLGDGVDWVVPIGG